MHDAAILVGRDGHVFRRRERAQLLMLARVADRAWSLLGVPQPADPWPGDPRPQRRVRGWVPAVVVFTRDLRVHDHPALGARRPRPAPSVPLFVFDDAILAQSRSTAPNRTGFLLESLDRPRRVAPRRAAAALVVRRGDWVDEVARASPGRSAPTPST